MVTIAAVAYFSIVAIVFFFQRSLLYAPSHEEFPSLLKAWKVGQVTIGYYRKVRDPQTIWLMTHGNAGQAAERDYVLSRLSNRDSLYVLEYPGYGAREGMPCRESFNSAATEAYHLLRAEYPNTPVCVLGESIGSGPACSLAREVPAPDKIVLVVPFDSLARVAAKRFFFLPARLLLHDQWDNVDSLRGYAGPVDIFGALGDTILPIEHAKALADAVPRAHFMQIDGGHNDWSFNEAVDIQR